MCRTPLSHTLSLSLTHKTAWETAEWLPERPGGRVFFFFLDTLALSRTERWPLNTSDGRFQPTHICTSPTTPSHSDCFPPQKSGSEHLAAVNLFGTGWVHLEWSSARRSADWFPSASQRRVRVTPNEARLGSPLFWARLARLGISVWPSVDERVRCYLAAW